MSRPGDVIEFVGSLPPFPPLPPTILSFASFADGRSGDTELERKMLGVFQRAYELWCERHRKYGRGNIGRHGAIGCLIRGDDKASRLENLYHGKADANVDKKETIEDSWLDMVNYAAMGLVCHRGEWPK